MDTQQRIFIYASVATVVYTATLFFYIWQRRYKRRHWDASDTLRRLIPILVAVFAGMVPLIATLVSNRTTDQQALPATGASEDRLKAFESDLRKLTDRVDALQKQLSEAPAGPSDGTAAMPQ